MTEHDPELVARVTKAVRLADEQFEKSGGSSRHWVRECFLDCLEEEGLEVRDVDKKPTHLDLLAYHLYQTQVSLDGQGSAFVRWWCMDEVLKTEYRAKAEDLYEKWAAEEQKAMQANDI